MTSKGKWLMGCLGTPLLIILFFIYILPGVVPKRKINIFHHEYELPLTIAKLRQHHDIQFVRNWGFRFGDRTDSIEYNILFLGPLASISFYDADSSEYIGYEEKPIGLIKIVIHKEINYVEAMKKYVNLPLPPEAGKIWRQNDFKYQYPNGIELYFKPNVFVFDLYIPDNVFYPKSMWKIFQEKVNPNLYW